MFNFWGSTVKPFSVLDLPNLALWLDAGDSSTFTNDTTTVAPALYTQPTNRLSQVRDKSGLNNHASASSGNRPYYLQDSGIGYPTLNFQDTGTGSTSQNLVTTNSLAAHSKGSFAIVIRPNAISGTEDVYFSISGNNTFGLFRTATGLRFGIKGTTDGNNALVYTASLKTSFIVITGRFDIAAGLIELRINGTSVKSTTLNTGIGTVSGTIQLGLAASVTDYGNFDASEFIYTTSYLSNSEITNLENKLLSKYPNITSSVSILGNMIHNWDFSDHSKVTLAYTADQLSSATVTGTSGTNTLTSSVDLSSILKAGNRIRHTAVGTATVASTIGANTYTVASVSGTTITLTGNLNESPSAATLYRGNISIIADKGTSPNNLTKASASQRPVFVESLQNGYSSVKADSTASHNLLGSVEGALGEHSGYIVMKNTSPVTAPNGDAILGSGNGINWRIAQRNSSAPAGLEYNITNTGDSSGIATRDCTNLNYMIVGFRSTPSGGIVELWENGQCVARNLISVSNSSFQPWLFQDKNSNKSNAEVAEVVMFDSYLSDANFAKGFGILNNKWNCYRNVSQMKPWDYTNPWRMRYLYQAAATEATALPTNIYDMHVQFGHSNVQGYSMIDGSSGNSPGLVAPFNTTLTNCLMYDPSAKVFNTITGATTVGSNVTRQGVNDNQHGPEIHCPYYVKQTRGAPHLVVKYAVGGTNQSAEWKFGTGSGFTLLYSYYIDAMNKTCYNANNSVVFLGFLRFLGINDAFTLAYSSEYKVNAIAANAHIYSWIGTGYRRKIYNMIQSTTGSSRTYEADIRQYDNEITAADPNYYMSPNYNVVANAAALTFDGVHCKSTTYDSIGQEFAAWIGLNP